MDLDDEELKATRKLHGLDDDLYKEKCKSSNIKLYKHQADELEATKNMNKVAIKDYEGFYEIDNEGNVYSLLTTTSRRKGKIKPHIKNGYLAVNLYKDGKCKHYYIHRLVAMAFIPNPSNKPFINHIDCDTKNNSVENLEWCTQSENILYASKLGRHVDNISKYNNRKKVISK